MPPFNVSDFLDIPDAPEAPKREEVSPWRQYGAMGLRGLAGLLSGGAAAIPGVGTAAGAVIGAGGELGAEMLGGEEPSAKRIAAEAALGAIPGGFLVKAGRPLASAARGAVFAGGGEALRELAAEENPLSIEGLKRMGTAAGIGGATSGVLGKLLGVKTGAPEPPPTPGYAPVRPKDVLTERPMPMQGGMAAVQSPASSERIPYNVPETTPKASRLEQNRLHREALQEQRMEQKMLGQAQKYSEGRQAARAVEAEEAATRARIAEEMSGMERGPVTATETLKAPGEPTVRIPYRVPEEPTGPTAKAAPRMTVPAAASKVEDILDIPPTRPVSVTPGLPEAAEETILRTQLSPFSDGAVMPSGVRPTEMLPQIPESAYTPRPGPLSPAGQLFRVGPNAEMLPRAADVAGEHYRDLQSLVKTGGATAEEAQGARIAGRALQREGKPVEAPVTPAVEPTPAVPDWVTEQTGVAEAAAQMDPQTRQNFLARLMRGESGQAQIGAMQHLGAGALGALIGGAVDPLGNPILSAAAGGVAGAALPTVVSKLANIGVPENVLGNLQMPRSIDEVKQTAQQVFETLPQIQRFNYLADLEGLPANVVAGPYGSAVMASLERGLSGDERGWRALEILRNPANFFKRFHESFVEAEQNVGRAEGIPIAEAGRVGHALGLPGKYMTAGDIAARKILVEAGIDPAEARVMTLTSEPELPFSKKIVSRGERSTLWDILFPFRRTPANILEQGAMRTPGLGFAVQAARETPDPLKQQLVQQGLGAGVGLGSEMVGEQLDPETARSVRRYLTNFAGQYSLPAALGFGVGQAMRAGKPAGTGLTKEMTYALPLPTVEPVKEWMQLLAKTLSGEANLPEDLPRGAVPAILRKGQVSAPFSIPGASPVPVTDFLDFTGR